jgi:hypothetical protein
LALIGYNLNTFLKVGFLEKHTRKIPKMDVETVCATVYINGGRLTQKTGVVKCDGVTV